MEEEILKEIERMKRSLQSIKMRLERLEEKAQEKGTFQKFIDELKDTFRYVGFPTIAMYVSIIIFICQLIVIYKIIQN